MKISLNPSLLVGLVLLHISRADEDCCLIDTCEALPFCGDVDRGGRELAGPNFGTIPSGGWSNNVAIKNGLEWMYASPCAATSWYYAAFPGHNDSLASSSCTLWEEPGNNFPDCIRHSGFRLPTEAELADKPATPPPCMAEYADSTHSHCDDSDYNATFVISSDGPGFSGLDETVYVRPVGTADSCTPGGGPVGDPHIKKWDGDTYNYHGECDLVVASSKKFGGGKGLELQMRTTIQDFYSFVDAAALRIGDNVLEVSKGKFTIDGIDHSDDELPLKFAGYTLGRSFKLGTSTANKLELNNGGSVQFRFFKDFMAVSITGPPEDFDDMSGLMGSYTHGAQYARDGKTILHDHDAFGAEWQVRPGQDPILFKESRVPQWPQTCNMPVATARHLRADPSLVKRAEEVCAHKNPEDFDFCVEDVLATKDEGMAGAW